MQRSLSITWFVRITIPALGDLVCLFAVLTASIALRSPYGFTSESVLAFIPLFALFLATFYGAGLYELRLVRDFVSLIGALLVSAVMCGVLGSLSAHLGGDIRRIISDESKPKGFGELQ